MVTGPLPEQMSGLRLALPIQADCLQQNMAQSLSSTCKTWSLKDYLTCSLPRHMNKQFIKARLYGLGCRTAFLPPSCKNSYTFLLGVFHCRIFQFSLQRESRKTHRWFKKKKINVLGHLSSGHIFRLFFFLKN